MFPITFEYKLYRHKKILVVGQRPIIRHNPSYGRGRKGFVLELSVASIDGVPVRAFVGNPIKFAWDRIIAKENLPALPMPEYD